MKKTVQSALGLMVCSLLAACATPPKPQDLSAYRQNMPRSILVIPPINNSPDTRSTYSFLSTTSLPIAEAGYYVFPVALVDQTFKENGVTNPTEMHSISPLKLREIFGADAAMYITVREYGTKYQIIQSVTTVSAEAKLIDLKTGTTLWKAEKKASTDSNNSRGNLVGALISAAVTQVVNQVKDHGHDISSIVSNQLFQPNKHVGNGLLYGFRSPKYQKDGL